MKRAIQRYQAISAVTYGSEVMVQQSADGPKTAVGAVPEKTQLCLVGRSGQDIGFLGEVKPSARAHHRPFFRFHLWCFWSLRQSGPPSFFHNF